MVDIDKDAIVGLVNSHLSETFGSYLYEPAEPTPEDQYPQETIRMLTFTCDVDVTVDGTLIPAGPHAMWHPDNEDNGVVEVFSYQLCDMEERDGQFYVSQIFGSTIHKDRPPDPIRFGEYLLEILRTETDEPDDVLLDALNSARVTRLTEQEKQQDIPALDRISVTTRVVPNSKPTQVLRRGQSGLLFTDGGMPLSVGRKRGQTQITFELQREDISIQTSADIDAEDVSVIESVATLRHAGNNVISPRQVVETMGYDPTLELQEEIHGRVLRLKGIVGRIDWTEQAKKWRITNPDTGEPFEHAELIDNLLNLIVFDGTDVKGNRYIRYKVISDPITYEHARLVGQVVEYPQELLDLAPIDEDGKEKKRVTREQRKLERAVLWYVFSLKNPKNAMSETVGYDALFDYDGFTCRSASARKRAIKFIHAYLQALQKAGVIYAFFPQIEQGSRHLQSGVKIIVEKPSRNRR